MTGSLLSAATAYAGTQHTAGQRDKAVPGAVSLVDLSDNRKLMR
ncbi:hypothetical protein GCM10007160_43470 [Litchfieldella qijiaojingensis]|uniref:Uncharacterized protein n=1 Tax=Litchfieldella qijiaojingensis TaxID=980347 RepID=A0ABQ2ZDP3_9GAMM|nr:hypothetical protein GCM10007160_43470 [Halomonas qijiaojingensis]